MPLQHFNLMQVGAATENESKREKERQMDGRRRLHLESESFDKDLHNEKGLRRSNGVG